MIDFRAPVYAMGKDRFEDIFDLASNKGFSADDASMIAHHLPDYWDGMDGLNRALMSFIAHESRVYLSEKGQEHAAHLVEVSK